MKNSVDFYEFRNWFEKNRPNNFSGEGLKSLFEYLEQYEADSGTELDFDPIALCCEYTEYDDLGEFHQNYGAETYPDEDAIMDCTTLIKVGGTSFIIQNF